MRVGFLILIAVAIFAPHAARAADTDYKRASVEQLIDALTLVEEAGPGLVSTANYEGFIAEDGPYEFTSGLVGAPVPVVAPQMRELVRRGPGALPALIRHLSDSRPTRISVGARIGDSSAGFFFLSTQIFSEEYDPRVAVLGEKRCFVTDNCRARGFDRPYVLRVGDLCYGLVGQIVNRNLTPVRYQPTAILVVNSPVQIPSLQERVRGDWGRVDANGLRQSLQTDIAGDETRWKTALPRLRLYFSNDYHRLNGLELKKRLAFEFDEKRRAREASIPQSNGQDIPNISMNRGIDVCDTLSRCLDTLEANVQEATDFEGTEQIALRLEAFGEPAKQQVLDRLTHPDSTWRILASGILAHWKNLSEGDLPALTEALQMNRGAFAYNAIAKIGSPGAIGILVADLRKYGLGSEALSPLVGLGAVGLRYLFPLLTDDDSWRSAAEVVSEMRDEAAGEARHWADIALMAGAPRKERIGALRGLAAMRDVALPIREAIMPLARANDRGIRDAANDALKAIN